MGVVPMSICQKRCRICGEWFMPDARTARFQKACSSASCRQERKRQADRGWRANNPGYRDAVKMRQWAAQYPTYWRLWRAAHPDYVERNRMRTRERQKASRLVFAKQDAIRRDPVGYLEDLRGPGMFAKQDAMSRPVDGILTFLIDQAVFAKQSDIDSTPRPVASS